MEFEEYANSLFPVLSLLPWLLAQLHIVFFLVHTIIKSMRLYAGL